MGDAKPGLKDLIAKRDEVVKEVKCRELKKFGLHDEAAKIADRVFHGTGVSPKVYFDFVKEMAHLLADEHIEREAWYEAIKEEFRGRRP